MSLSAVIYLATDKHPSLCSSALVCS